MGKSIVTTLKKKIENYQKKSKFLYGLLYLIANFVELMDTSFEFIKTTQK